MSDNESFFVRRRAAAAFKHGILSRYPRLFAVKAGSIVEGGKVVFLDGYAGAGRYDDGSPGSPLLFVRAALQSQQRQVRAIFVERDEKRFTSLQAALNLADPACRVKRIVRLGDLSDHLAELLPLTAGTALFAFLDPFGTALDLPRLREQLLRRPGREPTEVLLHFSVSTIARFGGILRSARSRGGLTPAEMKTVARADAFLGGNWWHDEFDQLPDVAASVARVAPNAVSLFDEEFDEAFDEILDDDILVTATDIAMRVAQRFCAHTGNQSQFRTLAMPVRPEQGRAPKYVLALFTRNIHGVWFFASSLGQAGVDWQEAVHAERRRIEAERFDKLAAAETIDGLFPMEQLAPKPPTPFDPVAYERSHRAEWVNTIATNLLRLFLGRPELRLVDHVNEVYGELLGHAWEKHVRAAVKKLYDAQCVDDPGTGGDFWRRVIHGGRRMPDQRSTATQPADERATEAG